MQNILFIGANNPEILVMLEDLGPQGEFNFCGFLDNAPEKKGKRFCGLPIFGGFDCLSEFPVDGVQFVNLITRDTETRFETSRLVAEKGFTFANCIHPSVKLAGVSLGVGNYIQRNVTLQVGVKIGDNTCINSGSTISHETTIGSSSFIAPGVTIAGLVAVGDGVMVGTGATVLPRVTLRNWTVVGAGGLVTKDTNPNSVVYGVPCVEKRLKPARMHDGKPW